MYHAGEGHNKRRSGQSPWDSKGVTVDGRHQNNILVNTLPVRLQTCVFIDVFCKGNQVGVKRENCLSQGAEEDRASDISLFECHRPVQLHDEQCRHSRSIEGHLPVRSLDAEEEVVVGDVLLVFSDAPDQ